MYQGGRGVRDVIVVGGGFAGVTAAREVALAGRSPLLLEAKDRLGGRTWTADWHGQEVEYGGGWVHWHQPHTWSELTRGGIGVELSDAEASTHWWVGDERRSGTAEERDAIAERGWNRFVAGCDEALPNPYRPLDGGAAMEEFDRLSILQRIDELDLDDEERAVLLAECESLAHGFADVAGAFAVVRWHQLSGGSLALTQYTGGRVTIRGGTRALIGAIAGGAEVETRLSTPVAAIVQTPDGVEVTTAAGETIPARAAIVAVPVNALGGIRFEPGLSAVKQEAIGYGQASRGIKIFIRARGEAATQNAIRAGHEFGYLATEWRYDDGTQTMIGFGLDAAQIDASDIPAVQAAMDTILPGYEVLDATAHDWLSDPYARGTWAIHRPGWYARYHAEMRRPEGRIVLAGSDLANGWAGFMDGAIESGLTSAREALRLL
jgi:monoamine oxidase